MPEIIPQGALKMSVLRGLIIIIIIIIIIFNILYCASSIRIIKCALQTLQ